RQNQSLLIFSGSAWLFGWMCAHGPSNVWSAHRQTVSALMRLEGVPSTTRWVVGLALIGCAAFLVWVGWRRLSTRSARIGLAIAVGVVLFVPVFRVVSVLPFFREIRAPFVFYDVHGAFFGALILGFLLTDVVRRHAGWVAGGVALAMVVDYWPYQRPCKDNGVQGSTLANLRAVYRALREDTEPVKVYTLSGRYFHLLGPMWSGKPQVWEAFYNWMAPRGLGDLVTQAGGDPTMLRVVGARYVLFDKSDPSMAGGSGMLEAYRKQFPVNVENDDFVVFRHPQPVSYVTGYARAWAALGDSEEWVRPALALANSGRVLIATDAIGDATRFERVCRLGEPFSMPIQPIPLMSLSGVKVERLSAHEIRIVVGSETAGWLVIAESWYPFWKATLNGRPVVVHRAFQGLMAVELPAAGQHEVVLHYRPPAAYRFAMGLSAVALICAFGWWVRTAREATGRSHVARRQWWRRT
ncbi:MAG: YfhO family protein, partial [Verrucomicrobiae bacterium]|nr:YfhO family protein [Verrucomicrobiae bacterium]